MAIADPVASLARAQRAMEHLLMMQTIHGEDMTGRWVAISLEHGGCDQRLYESKAEAVKYQRREEECAYLCATGMPTKGELRYFLDENERLYDAGMSLADPATYVNPETFL